VKNLPADFYFTGNIFMIENGVVVEIHGLASSVISDPISVISELTMDDFDENSSAKKKRKAKFVGEIEFDKDLKDMRFDTRKEIVAFIKTEKFKNIGKHCSMVNPNSSSGNVVHLKCDDCES
jgi:hypothetical protein